MPTPTIVFVLFGQNKLDFFGTWGFWPERTIKGAFGQNELQEGFGQNELKGTFGQNKLHLRVLARMTYRVFFWPE